MEPMEPIEVMELMKPIEVMRRKVVVAYRSSENAVPVPRLFFGPT